MDELAAVFSKDKAFTTDSRYHCGITRHNGNKLFFCLVSAVNCIRVNMFGQNISLASAVTISIRGGEALDVVDGVCNGKKYDSVLSLTFLLVTVECPTFQIIPY